jgi:hypothetical protein
MVLLETIRDQFLTKQLCEFYGFSFQAGSLIPDLVLSNY